MSLSMDRNEQGEHRTKWGQLLLVASLAFNIFGLSWYVTHGYMDSNLAVAQAIRELKPQSLDSDFSEVQMIERISSELSDEGARVVFQEYALRKSKLDELIARIGLLQRELKLEISRDVLREKMLREKLEEVSDLMSQRLDIMTDLMGDALVSLSDEDRQRVISKK